jgi:hypothetical protein
MMTECLGESDVNELAQAALTDFDQEVASLPGDLCVPFNQAAGQLEAGLLIVYRVVAKLVRKEDDLGRIAEWWGTMVSQCDEFAKRLRDLSLAHPACTAEFYYDRVLDLRNKCKRLQQMHS